MNHISDVLVFKKSDFFCAKPAMCIPKKLEELLSLQRQLTHWEIFCFEMLGPIIHVDVTLTLT